MHIFEVGFKTNLQMHWVQTPLESEARQFTSEFDGDLSWTEVTYG